MKRNGAELKSVALVTALRHCATTATFPYGADVVLDYLISQVRSRMEHSAKATPIQSNWVSMRP
jgi:hypothetical protein